jgi:hypothetical protein
MDLNTERAAAGKGQVVRDKLLVAVASLGRHLLNSLRRPEDGPFGTPDDPVSTFGRTQTANG